MAEFKEGDKVKCVETDETDLSSDIEYTISKVINGFVTLKGIPFAGFYNRRFEKVQEPKFKVGSRVWSPAYGWGEVQLSKDETFSVRVRFDAGETMFYTSEGKTWRYSPLPTLFLDEVPASNWPNPPAKLDPSTFVVDQYLEAKIFDSGAWILVKFAMFKNGAVWVFSRNNDSKSAEIMYKALDFRLPIAPKGV